MPDSTLPASPSSAAEERPPILGDPHPERLLVVLPSFALGGLRTHALTLAEGAARAGHRMVLVAAGEDAAPPASSEALEVRQVGAWNPQALEDVAAVARECTGVVVVASPATVALLPRLDGLRCALAVHGNARTLSEWLGPRTSVLRAVFRQATGLSVLTPGAAYEQQIAELLDVRRDAVASFRNSCLLTPAEAPAAAPPRALTLVARLAMDKVCDLEAGIALAQVMGLPLRVVGSGPAAAHFVELLQAAGVVYELVESEDVSAAVDEAEALVASGIVALEGLTRGKPVVIASSSGGTAGVVTPANFADMQASNWGGGPLEPVTPTSASAGLRGLTTEDLREVQRLVLEQASPEQTYLDVLAGLRHVHLHEGQADLGRTALDAVDELDTRWRRWAEELETDRGAWRQRAESFAAGTAPRSADGRRALEEVVRASVEQRRAHEQVLAQQEALRTSVQAELQSLRQGIDALAAEREELDQAKEAAEHLQAQHTDLRRVLAAVEHHRDALLTSTSWRLTAPLRTISHLRHRADDLARLRAVTTPVRMRKAAQLLMAGDVAGAVRRARLLVRGETLAQEPVVETVERLHQEAWPPDQPLVSVVIPCFNYGRYVRQAVDSVLAQTLPRVEVILIEAGSTDGTTPGVVQELERELGDRIRVLYREGRHLLGDNRNFGFQHARGKYVCSLDADDMLHPLFLEMAIFLLEAHGYDVVSSALQCFGGADDFVGTVEYPTLEDMLEGNYIYAPGVFRREAWERTGGYHDTGLGADLIYEDWRFWQRLLAQGARAANFVGQPLFYYRRSNDGASQSSHPDVPDLAAQRRAVAAFNEDVISHAALEQSSRRARTRVIVEDPLVNLTSPSAAPEGVITVLVALPFMLVGGVERLVSGLMASMPADRYHFIVVTTLAGDPSHGDSTPWFEAVTPEVYALPRLLPQSRWGSFLDYLVTAKSVDVLWLLGSEHIYDELPRLTATHPRLRVVDNLFNTEGHTRNNRRHRSHIDLHVVENEEVRTWLIAHGEPADRVVLTGSGVDVSRYAAATLPRPQKEQVLVGFVGRLSAEKNPLAVLDVAAAVPAYSPLRFVVAGGGPLADDLTRQIAARGLSERVTYLGVLEDVTSLLADLDVLLLPSLLDGSPQVVLEAQASGVAVVASDVGGLPSLVVHGRTGLLCPPTDTTAFARALATLSSDRGLLADMQTCAREHAVETFSLETLMRTYDEVFARATGRGSAAATRSDAAPKAL